MKLRKYRATTEAEAFRQVRADLGTNAIIISSKPVRPRGLRGLFGQHQEVEVTAVTDLLATNEPQPAPALPSVSRSPARPTQVRQEYADIRRSLTEISTTLAQLNQTGNTSLLNTIHENLRDAHRRLVEHEIEPTLADRLIAAVQDELSPRALEDRRTVIDCLRRHVAHLIRQPEPFSTLPNVPISLFLVGPTGVGKTTTIAKLAARFALLERQRVTLITVDTFRVAAAEQLRTYARIIGLPFEVAYTPGDLAAAVHSHRSSDIILIDTPGRSQHNTSHLQELQAYLQAVPQRHVYLTLDACTRYSDMLAVVQRFAPDDLDGIVVTKLDETSQYGCLLNLADYTNCPLTYLTTGQEVPDDIEEVTAHRITELVLGGVL